MKANELMIGNWVIDNGKYAQITGITCDGIIETTVNKNSNIELIEPIPITPEILEKNGFELKPDGWIWCKDDGNEEQNYIFIQFRKGCDEVRTVELNFVGKVQGTFRQVQDVHELQNLLNVCRIKKEIEL